MSIWVSDIEQNHWTMTTEITVPLHVGHADFQSMTPKSMLQVPTMYKQLFTNIAFMTEK